MKLNGWNRVGIVLSVLWALFLGWVGWVNYAHGAGGLFVDTIPGQAVTADPGTPDRCTQVDPEPTPKTEGKVHSIFDELNQHRDAQGRYCTDAHFVAGEPARMVRTPDQHRFMWSWWLFCTFVTLMAGWTLAYLLVFCCRWVAAGFRNEV